MPTKPPPGESSDGGILIPAELLTKILKKNTRLFTVRSVQLMTEQGETQAAIARELGISRSTVAKMRDEWAGPTATEVIERAAIDGRDRDDLVQELTYLDWLLHGRDPEHLGLWQHTPWSQLTDAVADGLLTIDEYARICDGLVALAAWVLTRDRCDPRTCSEHAEHVYIVCYGEPVKVSSRDWHGWDRNDYPISHYVGWTTQHPVVKRLWQHGAKSSRHVAAVVPGTDFEESILKEFGTCPTCGGSLDYFAENREREHFNPLLGWLDAGRD